MSAMLEVRGLQVAYGHIEAVQGIDFEVNAGEIRTLVAASATQVRDGHQLARETDLAIRDMVAQVERMSTLVKGIWETTFAQSSGINLLGETVESLSRSAESSVALIEQTRGATASLEQDARRQLARLVGRFRLADAARA